MQHEQGRGFLFPQPARSPLWLAVERIAAGQSITQHD